MLKPNLVIYKRKVLLKLWHNENSRAATESCSNPKFWQQIQGFGAWVKPSPINSDYYY